MALDFSAFDKKKKRSEPSSGGLDFSAFGETPKVEEAPQQKFPSLTMTAPIEGRTKTSTPMMTDKGTVDLFKEASQAAGGIAKGLTGIVTEPGEFRKGLESGKSMTRASLETIGEAAVSRVSDKIREKGYRAIPDFLDQVARGMKKSADEQLELANKIPVQDPQKFADAIQDPKFVARGLGQNIPNLLAGMGVGITGTVVGGPAVGITSAFGFTAALEAGFVLQEAKQLRDELGVDMTDDELENLAAMTGVTNGFLETIPIGKVINRVSGGKKLLIRQILREIMTQAASEGVTESMQQIVSNAALKVIDENRSLFEGVPESAYFGTITGGGIGLISGQPVRGLSIEDVSQGIFNELPDKPTISKQEAQDAVNRVFKKQGIKKVEQDIIDDVLSDFDGAIDTEEFANKMQARLLPLTENDPLQQVSSRKEAIAELESIRPLAEEARKYKSAEDFRNEIPSALRDIARANNIKSEEQFTKFWESTVGKKADEFYGMAHRPSETGATADDISKGGFIPEDVYTNPEWYANMSDKTYQESFAVLEKIKGNPDAEIIIYRASPKNELNNGDWVTLSKSYAKQESLAENTPVHSFKVKAKDVQFAGDDINEFGYYPKSQLTDLYNQAKDKDVTEGTKTPRPRQMRRSREVASLEERAEVEGALPSQERRLTRDSLEMRREEISMREEVLRENPARRLAKYANKNNEIPEVTGEKGGSVFAQKGDDIVEEIGFPDSETAREAYQKYRQQKKELEEDKKQLMQDRRAFLEERRNLTEVERRERDRMRQREMGEKVAREELKKETVRRRSLLTAIQKQFGLSNADMRNVTHNRDVTRMSEEQFEEFTEQLRNAAEELQRMQDLKAQVKGTIFAKELQKTENLRRALGYPPITQMSEKELVEFDALLSTYKDGDEFLTPRQIETVDNTDLTGIRTIREARERIAEDAGVPIEELEKINVGELDQFRYDTALAERNPFYKMMVDETNKRIIEADLRFQELEDEINEVITRARKSRKRTVVQKLVPTDERIFEYLEADPQEKLELKRGMTQEEVKAANVIAQRYEEAREYLIQHKALERYRSNYITHIRRGFLEAWTADDGGFFTALKEMVNQYKQDEAYFDILNGDTGLILPLEKFFKFSMQRTGHLTPTKNVARAVTTYFRQFERKKGLDALIPKIDIYAQSLTPKQKTPRGLEVDRRLKQFTNEWLNTKKGRRKQLALKPGGKLEWGLRATDAFVTLHDLALNIPLSIAIRFGEGTTNFVMLGAKNQATGASRRATKKGRAMIKKYQEFVGRTPWDEMQQASKDIGDRLSIGMFGLMRQATVNANKTFFLGSLTKEEWQSGEISSTRLAEIRREMGRYRVVDGSGSIMGATTEGSIFKRYKTWAVPIFSTTVRNLNRLKKMALKGDIKSLAGSREFHELLRETLVLTVLTLAGQMWFGDDDDDDSFTGAIIKKSFRDAFSLIGALDPKTFASVPRTISFINDLGEALSSIIRLEKYKTKDGLKGVQQLERELTPGFVRQITSFIEGDDKEEDEDEDDLGLDLGDLDVGDLDLDLGDLDLDVGDLDLDLGDVDIGDISI